MSDDMRIRRFQEARAWAIGAVVSVIAVAGWAQLAGPTVFPGATTEDGIADAFIRLDSVATNTGNFAFLVACLVMIGTFLAQSLRPAMRFLRERRPEHRLHGDAISGVVALIALIGTSLLSQPWNTGPWPVSFALSASGAGVVMSAGAALAAIVAVSLSAGVWVIGLRIVEAIPDIRAVRSSALGIA